MGNLTLQGAKALANVLYDHGGDYLLEMLSDVEIESRFCGPGGKRNFYEYLDSVEEMRRYLGALSRV